ncbi:MAG TPA: hypothetical protein VNH18_11625, partial [Bryobacteraceae bacterium]|nr:hypothetical protein [Bryobacteraceae bacterium]
TEREVTLDCPLDCEYLTAAHRHEKSEAAFDIEKAPNRDIAITEQFLEEYQVPMALIGTALVDGALKVDGKATDYDAREALQSLIQTLRAASSGLVVEAELVNPYAVAIRESLEARIAEFRRLEAKATGKTLTDDETVLKMLVFLQRLEFANNNGRRYSKAFLGFLNGFRLQMPDVEEAAAEMAAAEAPRVIL